MLRPEQSKSMILFMDFRYQLLTHAYAGMVWPSDVTLSWAAIKPGKARDLILVFVEDRVDTKWSWLSAAQRHHAILVHSYYICQIQPLVENITL